eukprot:NODE_26848_length_535_cov_4.210784.p1 GENE.NODE_26848_length_535_cov_4.210784~~NODE_26848_length_535_cov_4.210784.p1  ORF type:complete len:159 (+),score=50.90 NODE_26848_length_535_cov_4.210784:59-478(+)
MKVCRVKSVGTSLGAVPHLVTHDGRTIRYPHPDIKANDSIKLNIEENKIDAHIKLEVGCLVMISGGNSIGRVGTLQSIEKHPGSFDIAHVKDAKGHNFATRSKNVFVIGSGAKALISLPKGNGIKLSVVDERNQRLQKR